MSEKAEYDVVLDRATDAVIEQYAIFRSPDYLGGSELSRPEVRQIIDVALTAAGVRDR